MNTTSGLEAFSDVNLAWEKPISSLYMVMDASNVWKVRLYTLILRTPHYGTIAFVMSRSTHPSGRWKKHVKPFYIMKRKKKKEKRNQNQTSKKLLRRKKTPNSYTGIQSKWVGLQSIYVYKWSRPTFFHEGRVSVKLEVIVQKSYYYATYSCSKVVWQHALMKHFPTQ